MTEGLSAAADDRRWAKVSTRRPSPTGIRLTSGPCGYSMNHVSVSSTSSREEKVCRRSVRWRISPALWGPRKEAVPDRVILLGLDIKMFYGGPKEAVMHSIYRQNFGFTNIIIGRKHADAPYHDGTAIWGDFDAQEIFGKLAGDLKIQPIKVGFAAYYDSIGRVDLTDNHAGEKPVSISGKDVRKALLEGSEVDPRIMRPSTSHILAAAMKQ